MKLSEHVEYIRKLIDQSFRNRLGRMGISNTQLPITNHQQPITLIYSVFKAETGTVADAYEKLVEELTFTLFNRLAALKVMEAHTLHPEMVTRRESHGGRSFAHLAWLEQNPNARNEEAEGLLPFLEYQLQKLSSDIPLFSPQHPYHLLPTALELLQIINSFNSVEDDEDVKKTIHQPITHHQSLITNNPSPITNNQSPITNNNQSPITIWQSDDVLGWLYESYNNYKKAAHKASGDKTEYNKVSIQSQVYTPRWVVQFLVDNSLGKLYLEMYPDSEIRHKYKIANAAVSNSSLAVGSPQSPITNTSITNHQSPITKKPLHEIRMIDPSTGSGNFLLYGFDLYYDLYIDQIENYGADYNEADIPKLIIENNLYGVDLDDRAIQLAQLGLYIKAKRKKRTSKVNHFNIVSSDFFLPAYEEVKEMFEDGNVGDRERNIIADLWEDLQNAHKFGSLIRLEEKMNHKWFGTKQKKDPNQIVLFEEQNVDEYESFRTNFFTNLQKAVVQNTAKQGQTFLNTKTQDAITFLQLLTQKYDVAVANPPYTDSADFGSELKKFVEANYKQPYKFNTNLYAAFIKRCYELTTENGFIAMIHPFSFMFIKSYEDVRKLIIEKTHIEILIDYGLDRVNVFDGGYASAPTIYILSKITTNIASVFFRLIDGIQEKDKKGKFEDSFLNYFNGMTDDLCFKIHQNDLKLIDGFPFIYWISDAFRNQFKNKKLRDVGDIVSGLKTGNNEKCLRFWWEVDFKLNSDSWALYHKGGNFNKWYGNKWLCINHSNDFALIREQNSFNIPNSKFIFAKGITYNGLGGKGVCARLMDDTDLFDMGSSSIFLDDVYYSLGFINSKLINYILNAFNPTVNTQPNDIERVPYAKPSILQKGTVEKLSQSNVEIKKHLCLYHIIENNFEQSPLSTFQGASIKDRVLAYLNFENAQHTQVLVNEAIINELIFEVYELSDADREQVEAKMGLSIGSLPVCKEAISDWLLVISNWENEPIANHQLLMTNKLMTNKLITNYQLLITNDQSLTSSQSPITNDQSLTSSQSPITNDQSLTSSQLPITNDQQTNHQQTNDQLTNHQLPITTFEPEKIREIKESFATLYQSNNDLEEFCIRHQVNPINVWYWFKEANIIPAARASEIALEFLADAIRTLLQQDDDGIIPLVGLPGEEALSQRLEQHCLQNGFTAAQYMQLDSLLGRSVNEYLEHHFFNQLSNHLNLFMYLPKTPFIWHLSSGQHQGFAAYILIYKWNRDSLFKLKSHYISHRVQNLEYRQITLQEVNTAQAQAEKETIRLQLIEIEIFKTKIDELIAEGYDPKLDDGVGKNIAPLQKKGLLSAEVLKTTGGTKSQLEKYLNADW